MAFRRVVQGSAPTCDRHPGVLPTPMGECPYCREPDPPGGPYPVPQQPKPPIRPPSRLARWLPSLVITGSVTAIAVGCVPPGPPPVFEGQPAIDVTATASYTHYDANGIIAYHCLWNLNATVTLTNDNSETWTNVTRAVAASYVNEYGGAGCDPHAWYVKVDMYGEPDNGGPQGLWTGSSAIAVAMPFKREPNLTRIHIHIDATYNGQPAGGDKDAYSDQIHCSVLPTGGRTCLFPTT